MDLRNWRPYIRSVIPHVVGSAVTVAIALILLLSFLAWRLVRICFACCCACAAGPRLGGKKAAKLVGGKGAKRLKAALLLAAAGALAGAVWGVYQASLGGCRHFCALPPDSAALARCAHPTNLHPTPTLSTPSLCHPPATGGAKCGGPRPGCRRLCHRVH